MKKAFLFSVFIALMGIVGAQTHHWTPMTGNQYNMTVNGVIVIDGVEQTVTTLEVGAFCGDECRASSFPQAFGGQYVVPMTIRSNAESGIETISFKLYDHVLNEELDLECVNTVTFEVNGALGAPGNWFQFSFVTPASTFTLPITGYGTSAGGYYLIAPPIDDVDPATIEGMTTGDFDLYYFDEGEEQEWRNYEASPFNLVSGKGYLYAHRTDVTLSFTGTPYSGNGQVTLAKTAGAQFAGWNLVGNPFAQAATIDRDCYVMKVDGTEIIAGSNRTVNPMQGVFVLAASDNEVMSFSPQGNATEGGMIVCNVLKDRASAIDRAIVRFDGNGTLPKFMLNPDNTKLYIPNDGADYAVMTRSADNATPICFKARENGSYTLSVDVVNLDMEYLHLIDNKTGADIDLLQSPNYTFEASTTDQADRFKLVYATSTGISEDEKPFAYYVDGEIRIVEAFPETSLQIIDMQGRLIQSCVDGSHPVSTAGMALGVYVLRLVGGDSVRTQKVVVR